MNDKINPQEQYAAYLAIDWADQKHAFTLQVAGQSARENGTLEQKPEIIGPWVAKLRERFGDRILHGSLDRFRRLFPFGDC